MFFLAQRDRVSRSIWFGLATRPVFGGPFYFFFVSIVTCDYQEDPHLVDNDSIAAESQNEMDCRLFLDAVKRERESVV